MQSLYVVAVPVRRKGIEMWVSKVFDVATAKVLHTTAPRWSEMGARQLAERWLNRTDVYLSKH